MIDMVHRIEVTARIPDFPDSEGEALLSAIRELGISTIDRVRVVKIYKLETSSSRYIKKISEELLVEKLWQDFAINRPVINHNSARVVEVTLKPGMMNTEIQSIMKGVSDMGINSLKMAGSGKKYLLYGRLSDKDVDLITDKLLMNRLIENKLYRPEKTLVLGSVAHETRIIPLRTATENKLMELSQDKLWLNLQEMGTIKNYFAQAGRDPTDVELETIAQTWSEHCYHKTFKAELTINGKNKKPLIERIKQATEKINSKYTLSVFVDNAGVIEFNKHFAIAAKVETHNSPSAIEPYGGAATGSGGVFRDIISTGKGAKVVIGTDMFCFAPPDMGYDQVPKGCHHPRRLLKRVVAGVGDYGNRMGIPTNNGSVYFHADFRAKPTVIVGAYGIMPKKYVNKDTPRLGDLIFSVGGKTGRDGIHGATFSSGEMTDSTEKVSASAVQIGNAIEEKRMFDAILACRDKGLIRSIQDCGGGGFSSAIAEIAKDCGCKVYLDKVPLKYGGLAAWEIWLSESQEREILVVDPKKKKTLEKIFSSYNVEAVAIGDFTDSKKLELYYYDKKVCDLDMEFLHNGIPKPTRIGVYRKPQLVEPQLPEPQDYGKIFEQILASWNVCSKESIVRLYDHEVQGTSVLKPYSGVYADGANDAAVIEPVLGTNEGMAVAHGMHPLYNRIDPYWGAASAIDEAVRNLVAVGVDPSRIALLDNFIWPKPEKEELGQIDLAVEAICDLSTAWKMPFVSGKDSLSSTYKAKDGQVIKIPPVLCISAFAPLADIRCIVGSDLKQAGNNIYVIGETKAELGGGEYYVLSGKLGKSVPTVAIKRAYQIFLRLHKAIKRGLIASSHDCSDGGIAVTLAEMAFGGNLGARIDLEQIPASPKELRADTLLFSESNSRFLVEVEPMHEKEFLSLFRDLPCRRLGAVLANPQIEIHSQDRLLILAELEKLKQAWKKPMKSIFQ